MVFGFWFLVFGYSGLPDQLTVPMQAAKQKPQNQKPETRNSSLRTTDYILGRRVGKAVRSRHCPATVRRNEAGIVPLPVKGGKAPA